MVYKTKGSKRRAHLKLYVQLAILLKYSTFLQCIAIQFMCIIKIQAFTLRPPYFYDKIIIRRESALKYRGHMRFKSTFISFLLLFKKSKSYLILQPSDLKRLAHLNPVTFCSRTHKD